MTTRSSSPSRSPSPMRRSRKSCARKFERACCSVLTLFPLAFVYGLTTWAAWVVAGMGIKSDTRSILTTTASAVGVLLYLLLNWSYTTAVFTDPGSPLTSGEPGYAHLPTYESAARDAPSFTVKSTGEKRYCKKCQARKPDRAHHCSTCKKCVLKMDHHCPWLATCVGLKNYKAFLLFLVYTTVFCWVCFGMTTTWVWKEMFNKSHYTESMTPINYVLLCVISGIIGLVLTGFTAWHLSLAYRGQTTIECLEKTRYLTPVRNAMNRTHFGNGSTVEGQSYGRRLAEIHTNALPGVTRPEEGEELLRDDELEHGRSEQRTYNEVERSRERARYEDYMDEKDSEKLPNAFDLGWRRNLVHLLGPKPLLRCFPVCNTTGDGWHWEPNPKWIEAREAIKRDRERDWRERDGWSNDGSVGYFDPRIPEHHYTARSGKGGNGLGSRDIYHRSSKDEGSSSSQVSLKTLRRKSSFSGNDSSDDDDENF